MTIINGYNQNANNYNNYLHFYHSLQSGENEYMKSFASEISIK